MSHGLKSFAQELPKYGRYGDSMVAHINPQEAALLKSLGGSGTINPHTGLPEFWGGLGALNPLNKNSAVGKIVAPVVQPVANIATKVLQPVEKAVVQPIGNALASVDKSVGKIVPGGWGTLASMAGAAVGLPTYAMVGLGALNGSGVMHPGRGFNLQGAIMGGAMAYGMSELGEYARGAADVTPTVDSAGNLITTPTLGATPPADAIESLNASQGWTGAPQAAPPTAIPTSAINAANALQNVSPSTGLPYGSVLGDTLSGNAPVTPSIGSQIMSGNFGDAISQAGNSIAEGANSAYQSTANALDKATTGSTYTDAIDKGLTNASQTGSGIKNLLTGAEGASAAAKAAATTAGTMSPAMAAGLTAYAGMNLAQLDEQRQYLKDQAAAGALSNAEYNAELAKINSQADEAKKIVSEHPLQTGADISNVSVGPSLYARKNSNETIYDKNPYGATTLYAMGGAVNPPDDQTGMPTQSPMNNFDQGGIMSMIGRTVPQQMYAAGGEVQHFAFGGMPISAIADIIAKQEAEKAQAPGISAVQSNPLKATEDISRIVNITNTPSNATLYPNNPKNDFYDLDRMEKRTSYAQGGMPRFLSGGGDGMSDSIPASINGSQEARLADGEFVIPADVVSHIGNGSSKAGAKQLYSMMDRVRQARTGRKSQGKQINPRKYLAA